MGSWERDWLVLGETKQREAKSPRLSRRVLIAAGYERNGGVPVRDSASWGEWLAPRNLAACAGHSAQSRSTPLGQASSMSECLMLHWSHPAFASQSTSRCRRSTCEIEPLPRDTA